MWQKIVPPWSTNVPVAKYAFLKEIEKRRVLNVALIYTVIISLSLATIIAVYMAVLRHRETSSGRAGA